MGEAPVKAEEALGARLQAARKAAGLTQQGLCHQAGLSFSTLAKIERGAIKSPSVFTVQSIAEAVGTTVDALLGAAKGGAPRPAGRTRSGVSFIYFDINGCLIQSSERALTNLARDLGLTLDTVETAYWHFNDDACHGTLSAEGFNAAMAQRLGVPSVNWHDYFFAALEPIIPMQELLKWAATQYRVGLLSNVMPGLIPGMLERKMLPAVDYDVIIDSSAVGMIKPDAQIFERAAQEAGVPPAELLLIDDTRANLQSAERCGWHVLLFDGFHAEESVDRAREALEPAT